MTTAIDRVIAAFESLSVDSVDALGSIYAPNAHFVDPFNDVQGLPAIQRIFRHMFDTLQQPHFVVTGRVVDAGQCFLVWEFRFRFRSFRRDVAQSVHGTSHLCFDDEGLIVSHRDYWDAANELYAKMPLIGALMRWLRKRANS